MENGTIVEEGNHQELLNKREKYYNLWHKQTLV
jgi:ATP-binding cassette subfamily B protein